MLKKSTGSHSPCTVCCDVGSWALQQVETLKTMKGALPLPMDVPSPQMRQVIIMQEHNCDTQGSIRCFLSNL